MKDLFSKHKIHWTRKTFIYSVILGAVLFSLSVYVTYLANSYADKVANNQVTDLILSNIPTFNVNFVMTYGAEAFLIFVITILAIHVEKIPFTLKAISLLLLIRSLFIILTHIAQFQPQALLDTGRWVDMLGAGNGGGLFFSGHTAVPFMFALIFWPSKKISLIFLVVSIIFGVSVLLGHLHYSIDVLGAYFITYAVFHIALKLFSKDRELFLVGFNS